MSRRRVSCGLELCHVPELSNIIQTSAQSGYDFITIPIVNPRYEREFDKEKVASQRYGPLTRLKFHKIRWFFKTSKNDLKS